MYSVVDCVKTCLFSLYGKLCLTCGCTVLGSNSHFKIFLCGVCYNLAEHFSKFSSMLCFLVSSLFPIQTDFGIAFSVCNSCHSKIHTNLAAFAVEVISETLNDFLVNAVNNSDLVLCSPCKCVAVFSYSHLCLTDRANFDWFVTFVSANRTIILFSHFNYSLK